MDPRSAENIEGAQVLIVQNIGGALAPVPPLFLRPCYAKLLKHMIHCIFVVVDNGKWAGRET